jgi:hypothetical protein
MPAKIAIIQRQKISNVGEYVKKRKLSILVVKMQMHLTIMETSMEVPQKIASETTSRFSNMVLYWREIKLVELPCAFLCFNNQHMK